MSVSHRRLRSRGNPHRPFRFAWQIAALPRPVEKQRRAPRPGSRSLPPCQEHQPAHSFSSSSPGIGEFRTLVANQGPRSNVHLLFCRVAACVKRGLYGIEHVADLGCPGRRAGVAGAALAWRRRVRRRVAHRPDAFTLRRRSNTAVEVQRPPAPLSDHSDRNGYFAAFFLLTSVTLRRLWLASPSPDGRAFGALIEDATAISLDLTAQTGLLRAVGTAPSLVSAVR
jgi:hypothetical protein